VRDYLEPDEKALSVKYEYFNGRLRMLAGGSADHSIIAVNIVDILHGALRKMPCTVYTSDIHFKISEFHYVHPDVTVGCDERDKGKNNIQHPRLLVEVLSPSTTNIDKGEKLEAYLDCPSVEEYMLVDSQKKLVQIYHRDGDTWTSRLYKSMDRTVHLRSSDVSISFEDIYEKTSLAE
jgi:Uma2 family endonuclease